MFARIDAELGPLHGLVNNAGVVDVPQRVDDMSVARCAACSTSTSSAACCARAKRCAA
jgi:NAD(P)-dependent dehydrogenase (short-subunit alcohol dehydrogenase family)